MNRLRVALAICLYAATCVGCARAPQRAARTSQDVVGACAPLYGSDRVLVAPDDPRGLADSGLVVIAKWDGTAWRDCGVRQ